MWRTELQATDGAAAGTIRLRESYLRRFARVCSSPQFATRDAILAWLAPQHWEPETRKSARGAFVSFYGWYYEQGCIPDDPAANLPTVSVPPADPRPADPADVAAALRDARPREWLMVMLGAVEGMRRAEIAIAHSSDLRGNVLQIHGKGRRRRQLTLPAVIVRAIRARVADLGEGYLFPSPLGGPLTPGHVGKLISRALPDGTTPHQLRHYAASQLRDMGVPIEEIQVFLGHAVITTTMRYTAVKPRAVAAASARAADLLLDAPSTARASR